MQSPVHANFARVTTPITAPTGQNPQGLEQRPQEPTQRSAHSLRHVGQRLMRNIGQLTQDLRALPRPWGRSQNSAPTGNLAPANGAPLQRGAAPASETIELQEHHSEAAEASGATPRLNRSNAGRFDSHSERIQRQATPEPPSAGISLDAKGKSKFQHFQPPAVGDLLQNALGQPSQRYQAQHSAGDGQNHLLLDLQGHLLHVKQTPTALVALRSSQAEGPVTDKASASAAPGLTFEGNAAKVGEGAPLPTLGRAQMGHLTGIHEDSAGQTLRLHDGKLYELDRASATWQQPETEAEPATFSHLASQGDGKLYGQSGDNLVDLTDHDAAPLTVADLKAFSVNNEGIAASLSGEKSQTLQFTQLSDHTAKSMTLELNGGSAEPKHIGLTEDRLFVSDTEGRLYSVGRGEIGDDETTLKLQPDLRFQPPGEPLGGTRQAAGFLHSDDGSLHVLVGDKAGHSHSHPLDEAHPALGRGWNLSDALVLDNRRGLPGAEAPTPAATFDLDRSGRIGLSDGRVQSWDSTLQDWKDTGIKDISQLQRGIDSKAYLVQDGKLHKLDVKPKYESVAVNDTHALNRPVRTTDVALGDALPGLTDRHVTAFAMLNDKQFVALDDNDRFTAHHKNGETSELSRLDLEGSVASLALDENHNLHALTTEGKLFTLAKDDWQAPADNPRPEARWKPVPLPEGRTLASIRTADDNRLSATVHGSEDNAQVQLKGQAWQPLTPRPADQNALNDLFGRLKDGVKTAKIPGTGMMAKYSLNVMGRGAVETDNRASTGDYIRAHIFKPTLEVPRPLKNVGYHLQHRYQGREGLRPLYAAEGREFKRLELLSAKPPQTGAGQDLQSRIAALGNRPGLQGTGLVEALEAFRKELEDNSLRATQHLGRHAGKSTLLQQKEGLLNVHGELSPPSRRSQLSLKLDKLSQNFNFASSGHDFIKELNGALAHLPPSTQNRTGTLLTELRNSGLRVSHQKADIPLGQQRDASDSLGLIKARLALDVGTLDELDQVLKSAEALSHATHPGEGADTLKKSLSELKDKKYGEHPLKQITDMGFVNHAGLEGAYDGIKAFLNGFKKEDHATSVTLRAATGSKSQPEMAEKLKAAMKQLHHPDDEIALQRGYGVSVSTPFVALANKGMGPWPSGAVSGGRNYLFSAERGEKGVTVYLQREGAGTASGGVGGGKDLWPGFFRGENADKFTKVDIGNDRRMTPALRLGADVTGTATTTWRDGVVFTLPDEEIDPFIDNLVAGKLNPLELMKKGLDHEAQKSLRFNFDLTASGTAEFRVGFGLTDKDSTPLSSAARVGVGGTVSVNLLNYGNYSLEQHSNKGELQESSRNRPRLLNNFGVSGFARAQIAGSNTPASDAATPANQGLTTQLGITPSVSVDNKTTKRIKFNFKEAEPLTAENLDKLGKSLGKAFKDPESQRVLSQLTDAGDAQNPDADAAQRIRQQLQTLETHFAGKPKENDEQYAALRALTRAGVQQQAADAKHSLLDSGRFESTYTNLSRMNGKSAVASVMARLNPHHSPSNAERITALIEHDPTLKALVKQLQAQPGTQARVRLELKDDVQDRIDQGSRDGSLSQKELAGLLSDRNNMRIKAITVSQSVNQPESFTSPLPVLSYSSSASLNVSKALGKINFSYGQDQDTPKSYSLDGMAAEPGGALKTAVGALKQEGLQLKG
ncbi:AvrE-family type 3 secretion system effector [Pseudomonas sp. COR58]|uniref:AvrE-family type 3 secretion system effector n=1 Tax=Pseudomonas ekonensis TaxID=2842353 RepID=A0ABS6PDB2_9PSED|nr:AvrE-family type 3 secretion system effector [Pseudomonas ekonensis]MBV4458461.1 AvrE-family type 3 secretion system effector [Pseudomonas ekonensis]